MSNRLANKVAFITGGNSGIGLATAKAFVAEGANVVILARTQAKVDQAVAKISKNAMGVVGDVADLPSLRRAFEQVKEVYGRIDVVFANAGVAPATPLIETGAEQLDRVFDVNFKGAFFTVQYALPLLAPEASVVLVGSCISEMGTAGYSAYAASKAAVRSLARTLTPDLYEIGARINVLSPGPIDTPALSNGGLTDEQVKATNEAFGNLLAAGRVGQPEEMAAVAVFLASSESSFMRGADVQADGGMNQIRLPRAS
ncbi:General stress protein 39 [Pseudovibrio sp. Ad5]|uniref:SDR family oxidoreductase n=1 Tax=Pseudovibrio sp. Ad5 TaxID=989436 RepID=UPI0007AEB721|nr:SDR family oxidoreductase [Pseudovibrio sp. Ad5]KZK92740.1 General stress protein 39 [Pseudovibrio sp. Ad5]